MRLFDFLSYINSLTVKIFPFTKTSLILPLKIHIFFHFYLIVLYLSSLAIKIFIVFFQSVSPVFRIAPSTFVE